MLLTETLQDRNMNRNTRLGRIRCPSTCGEEQGYRGGERAFRYGILRRETTPGAAAYRLVA